MRDAGKTECFPSGKGIADLNRAVVVQANNVPRDRGLHQRAIPRAEGHRVCNAYILVDAHMTHFHALVIAA